MRAAALIVTTALAASACGVSNAAADPVETIQVGGRTGTFLVHLPRGGTKPGTPLVVATHGSGGTAAGFASGTGFNELADKHGFAVAYPDGYTDGERRPDLAFANKVLDVMIEKYQVNKDRIFATGASQGGVLTQQLACDAAGRLAGAATVVAQLVKAYEPKCNPSRPVPILMINGNADPVVPYAGGPVTGNEKVVMSSVQDTLKLWRTKNRCTGKTRTRKLPDKADDGTTTTVSTTKPCADGSPVLAYTVLGGGHTWPGITQPNPEDVVGKTSMDFNATNEIWRFFAATPKRKATV